MSTYPQVSAPTGPASTLAGSIPADAERLAAFLATRRNGNTAPLTIPGLSDLLREYRRQEDARDALDAEHRERIARERREYLELRAQVEDATDDELAAMVSFVHPENVRRAAHGEQTRRQWRERIAEEDAARHNPDGLLTPAEWNALSEEVTA